MNTESPKLDRVGLLLGSSSRRRNHNYRDECMDLIENPILNSPFQEPARHFAFDDRGVITGEILETGCVEHIGRHPFHIQAGKPWTSPEVDGTDLPLLRKQRPH
jgi:hypothetical protein